MRKQIEPAEERELVVRAQAGDRQAAGRLIQEHEGFLRQQARKFARNGDFEDCLQVARIALDRAIKTFEGDRNLRLLTYAAWWIVNGLQHHQRESAEIRLPKEFIETTNAARVVGVSDPEEIEKLPRRGAKRASRILREGVPHVVSADAPVIMNGEVVDDMRHNMWLVDDTTPESLLIEHDEQRRRTELIHQLLQRFPHRARFVGEQRAKGLSLEEIAAKMGCTRQNVSLILQDVIERLKRRASVAGGTEEAFFDHLDETPKSGVFKIAFASDV